MNHWEANMREHPPKCTCADCNERRLAGGDNRLRRQRRPDGDYEVDGYGRFWKIKHPLLSPKVVAELEETLGRAEAERSEKEPAEKESRRVSPTVSEETLGRAEAERSEKKQAEKESRRVSPTVSVVLTTFSIIILTGLATVVGAIALFGD